MLWTLSPRRIRFEKDVDCGRQGEDVEDVNVVFLPFIPPVSKIPELKRKVCTVGRESSGGHNLLWEVSAFLPVQSLPGCKRGVALESTADRLPTRVQTHLQGPARTSRDLRRERQGVSQPETSGEQKQAALREQARATRGLMAAKMLTVDWRGRPCHRRHLVWLCQSLSLRGSGRQVHRQEGGRDPSGARPYP